MAVGPGEPAGLGDADPPGPAEAPADAPADGAELGPDDGSGTIEGNGGAGVGMAVGDGVGEAVGVDAPQAPARSATIVTSTMSRGMAGLPSGVGSADADHRRLSYERSAARPFSRPPRRGLPSSGQADDPIHPWVAAPPGLQVLGIPANPDGEEERSMATVTFDHVFKRYGTVTAVEDLSLSIGDGEFMVLVGPSGCGKTTSLRMVAGLEEISEGTLRIGDRVVNDVPPKDRDIAMVFQSYALYPHMSVKDNLAFGLKLRHTPKAEIDRRVADAAEILDLGRYLQRKPKELSGGQRQRVALGRAIVREPSVFLMDEPLSNLDAKLRVQTRAEIARLHQRLKTTIVYVTHDQVEAMTMGDRIAVMSEGRLQQVGTPQELYDYPLNRFVAGFIGSPSMNFIEVKGSGGGLIANGVSIPVPDRYRAAIGLTDGRSFIAGFRPEHFELGPAADGMASVSGVAEVVEYLGSQELLHVNMDGTDLVAIVDSSSAVKPGQALTLRLPLDKAYLFDSDTGLSLEGHRQAIAA